MPTVIVIALALHYGTALILLGSALFQRLVPPEQPNPAGDAGLRHLLIVCAAAAAVSIVALVMIESASMAEDWTAALAAKPILAVLTKTRFGGASQGQFALVLVVLIALIRGGAAGWVVSASSAALVASLALVGHPDTRGGGLLEANHAVHLLAASAWVGGLPILARRLIALRADGAASLRCLRQFSNYAWIAVVAVVATGTINAAVIASPLGDLAAVLYGTTLFVKLALVAVMIIIACANRFLFLPQLAGSGRGLARLRALTVLELALGVAVIVAASLLGTLSPPGE